MLKLLIYFFCEEHEMNFKKSCRKVLFVAKNLFYPYFLSFLCNLSNMFYLKDKLYDSGKSVMTPEARSILKK